MTTINPLLQTTLPVTPASSGGTPSAAPNRINVLLGTYTPGPAPGASTGVNSDLMRAVTQANRQAEGIAIGERNPYPTDGGCWGGSPPRLPFPFPPGFPPIGLPPIGLPPIAQGNVSPGDLNVATRLHHVLSNPETMLNAMIHSDCDKAELTRGLGGGVQGPDGQPLFPVKTEFGNCYVDPNTNQFYLADPGAGGGHIGAIGPMDLPEGCDFSNSYFDAADVRELGNVSRNGLPDPLDRQDRNVAKNLHQTLSGAKNEFFLRDPFLPSHELRTGVDGHPRGPDGQPLVQVTLDSGQHAFVDPNTNQYYLRSGRGAHGGVEVKGPLPMPEDARFTNTYFNERDTEEMTRLAQHQRMPRIYSAL